MKTTSPFIQPLVTTFSFRLFGELFQSYSKLDRTHFFESGTPIGCMTCLFCIWAIRPKCQSIVW